MKRYWISALFFLFFSFSGKAEKMFNVENQKKIDSLYDLAWEYLWKNPDSTLVIGNKQLELSTKAKNIVGMVKAYYVIGYSYYLENYFDLAAQNYYKALDVIGGSNDPILDERKMLLLQNLGVVYEKTFNYDLAIKYYQDALLIANKLSFESDEEILNYNIGVIYRKTELYDKAMMFYRTALGINLKGKNLKNRAKFYNAIGNIYHLNGEYEKAFELYTKAVDTSLKDKDLENDRSMFLSNIGENYSKLKKYDKAISIFEQALIISRTTDDKSRLKLVYNNIADVYLQINEFKLAISNYQNTIELGNPKTIDKELQRAYKNIAQAYEGLNQYKLALEYKSKYIDQTDKIVALKEDLTEQNAQYRMKELDWQREMMQKEVMLASAEKENLWGRIIIGIALLMIAFSGRLIFVYYQKISKARKIVNSYSVDYLDF